MSPSELLRKVEAYLARTKQSATAFSCYVSGDPALVLKMRRGRQLRYDLENKVLKAIGARK